MKQKNLRRRLAALLLMLCLLAAGALPALATSANIRLVDASGNPATGTIRVALYDSAKDKALSGGQLTLYRVAEVKRKNGDLSFEYCGDFYGCGIALGDLTDSTLADQLLEYMPQGVQSKASNGYAPIKPFLVSLPMAENGKWNYEVDASPKVGGYTPVNPDTPPVPPTPVPDKPGTPEQPTEPTNPDTPKNPDGPDSPVSPGSPDSPVAPGNPDNPAAPGKPDNPALAGRPDGAVMNGLPQTGQLNWPVPVLAVSGVLLFAAGWVLNKKEALP